MLLEALDLLKDETHDQLPEGQLRLQVKDTLTQLEQFMKTLGCEMQITEKIAEIDDTQPAQLALLYQYDINMIWKFIVVHIIKRNKERKWM